MERCNCAAPVHRCSEPRKSCNTPDRYRTRYPPEGQWAFLHKRRPRRVAAKAPSRHNRHRSATRPMLVPSPDRLRETRPNHNPKDSPSDHSDKWPSRNPRTRPMPIRRQCKPSNRPRRDASSDRLPRGLVASRIRNLQRQSSFHRRDYRKRNQSIHRHLHSLAEEQTHQKPA